MTAECSCRDCRYPAVGDVAVKAAHAEFHRRFQRRVDEAPDWHWRKPTPREVIVMVAAEWDVPRTCPRVEDAGKPAHPAPSA